MYYFMSSIFFSNLILCSVFLLEWIELCKAKAWASFWALFSSSPSPSLTLNLHSRQSGIFRTQVHRCVRSWALWWSHNAVSIRSYITKVASRATHGRALPGSSASFWTTFPIILCTLATLVFFLFNRPSHLHTKYFLTPSQFKLP